MEFRIVCGIRNGLGRLYLFMHRMTIKEGEARNLKGS